MTELPALRLAPGPATARQPAAVTPLQRPRKTTLLLDPALPLTDKQYWSWSHVSEIPAHAQIFLLTDAQLGKVLAYHCFTMDLLAPTFPASSYLKQSQCHCATYCAI